MDKIKLLTMAVIGLLLLNAGMLAAFLLHRPSGPPPARDGGPKRIIIERLHLDPSQVEEYEVLIAAHRSSMDSLDRERQQLKNQLYSMLKMHTDDLTGAKEIISSLGINSEKTEEVNFRHFLAIRKLCRPDQLASFDTLAGELARLFAPHGPPPPPQ